MDESSNPIKIHAADVRDILGSVLTDLEAQYYEADNTLEDCVACASALATVALAWELADQLADRQHVDDEDANDYTDEDAETDEDAQGTGLGTLDEEYGGQDDPKGGGDDA